MLTLDFPPQGGGMSRHCGYIARILSAENDLRVVSPGAAAGRVFDNYFASCAVFFLKGLKFCLARRPAFACAHTWSIAGVAALALKKTLGVPYAVFAHGLDVNSGKASSRALWLMKKTLANSSVVLANSSYTAGLLRGYIPQEKIKVLFPAIDAARYVAPAPVPEGFSGKRVILSVGRLVESKGHDTVICSLPAVLEKFPDAALCIAGAGPQEQALKDLARELKVQDKVIFAGHVPDEKLAGYYQHCAVFVLASRELPGRGDIEGFGMVFLEAGACGKAVVGTRCGGIPEAVLDGVTGILAGQQDAQGIAFALVKILGDAQLRQLLGENGKKRVARELSIEAFGNRLRSILEHTFDAKA